MFNFPAGFNPLDKRGGKHAKGGLSSDQKAAKSRRQRQKMKRHKRRFHLN
mgnify:CR=1 FL=1